MERFDPKNGDSTNSTSCIFVLINHNIQYVKGIIRGIFNFSNNIDATLLRMIEQQYAMGAPVFLWAQL